MKNCITCLCALILVVGLRAQTSDLVIKNSNKGLYIDHKVTAKENFYSIGRLFNVHPKHIASFNSLDMTKGLGLGQMIRIPLTDTNFNQKTEKGQPVYYMTGTGENLRRVSTNNNNVLIENLRQWNNLFTDNVANGSKLIVGYLVTKQTPPTPTANSQKVQTVTNPTQTSDKDVAKTEPTSTSQTKKDVVKQDKEEPRKEESRKEEPKKEESKKEELKKGEPPKEEPKKEEPKKEVVPMKQETKPQSSSPGYFKMSFDQQVKQRPVTKDQTLTSGVFKTASGWSDAKYYLLMDGVEPGTIVKITNPVNNKMIYAKLLGEMTALKQNKEVNIRISNAAASALDIAETEKFTVKLSY